MWYNRYKCSFNERLKRSTTDALHPHASKSVGSLLVSISDETGHFKTLCPDPSVNVEVFVPVVTLFQKLESSP